MVELTLTNDKQAEICTSTKNYVLTACPGSGKTRTIVYRLAYLHNKYPDSRKLNVAITYTNRASNEMEKRLYEMRIDTNNIWIGTIHQFCMQFIIRPYAMYSDRLRCGFRIIDEFQKNEYGKQIANKFKVSPNLWDLFGIPEIVEEYENLKKQNKEIDFDDILRQSCILLQKYEFIAENIARIIRSIHIDEYQDTNELQYIALSCIVKKNPSINVLFVGDVNQAIYSNLGGVAKSPDEIRNLFQIPFCEDSLTGCYRSTQRLIDYYREFSTEPITTKSLADYSDESGLILYNNNIKKTSLAEQIKEVIISELSNGVREEEICVAAPQWYQLFPLASELKTLLPEINFDAPDITAFKYEPLNPFYILASLIFSESGRHVRLRKKRATEFITIVSEDYKHFIPDSFDAFSLLKIINKVVFQNDFIDGIDCFSKVWQMVCLRMLGTISTDDAINGTYNAFIRKVEDRISRFNLFRDYYSLSKCFKEKSGIVITTIHGMKGEEYNTVIACGLLNGFIPNWRYIRDLKMERASATKRLLYVLCSRAKKNIYLYSEVGRYTRTRHLLTPTDELYCYSYPYDSLDRVEESGGGC